jgi:hypothetical protein
MPMNDAVHAAIAHFGRRSAILMSSFIFSMCD